jgi:hypothetical protein
MKNYILIVAALFALAAPTAVIAEDGDYTVRPRPGSTVAADYFRTDDGSTTNFGRVEDIGVLSYGAIIPLSQESSVEPLSEASVERP